MTHTVQRISWRFWSHIRNSRCYVISNCGRSHTIGWVVNGDNDAGSQNNLLPGLTNVQDVDTVGSGLPQVWLHVHLEVLGSEMALGSEEHLDVLLSRVEDRGEVGGSHLVGSALQMVVCRVRMS